MKKILEKFKQSNLEIIDDKLLEEYIKFCFDNNEHGHTKFRTSYHHILPKAKLLFPEYKDLNKHPWNGCYLSHKNHYIAHYMLAKATNHISILSSFNTMNNKDGIKRLDEKDLIGSIEFGKILQRQKEEFSKHMISSGKSKEIGLKSRKTKLIEFINEDGEVTNTFIENGKKIAKSKIINSRKFNIHHIEFGKLFEAVSLNEIRKISNNLKSKTKENYMGKGNLAKGRLKDKMHFIGIYVEEVDKSNLRGLDISFELIKEKLKRINNA